MRKVEWRNGDQMLINTGHVAFDRQTSALTTGNIIGGTQYGNYIRAHNTPANPIGRPCEPGEMQKFDLQGFKNLPSKVKQAVETAGKSTDLNLHEFFSYRDQERVVHGYVLTLGSNGMHELVGSFVTGPTSKSQDVIATAVEYVSNPKGTMERIRAAGESLGERLDIELINTDPDARSRLDHIIEILSRTDDTISDGERILRHLAQSDIRPYPRTKDGAAAEAEVDKFVSTLDQPAKAALADAVRHLEKQAVAGLEDLGPEFSVCGLALQNMLKAQVRRPGPAP